MRPDSPALRAARPPRSTLSRRLALGAVAALAAALGTFGWLRGELAADLDRAASRTASALGPEVLGSPASFDFSLAKLDRLARRLAADDSSIKAIAVAKTLPARPGDPPRERLFAPYGVGENSPASFLPGARRIDLPLGRDDEPGAALFVALDRSRLHVATAWTAASACFLAIAVAAALGRWRRQEKRLASTMVELAEKGAHLARAERLALGGQLAANLLHDLRKPVNALNALAEDALDGADGRGGLEDWREARDRTREFRGILAASQFERFLQAGAGEREACDLADLLDRSLRLLKHELEGVEVERAWEEGPALVDANPWELIQLFSNLILNARQAAGPDGKLAIRLRREASGGRDWFAVEVEDNGPGVPAEFRPRLFEPFATTRLDQGGTGLGAYIARDIAQGLGGSLELAAEPGPLGGARFVTRFPGAAGMGEGE